MVAPHVRQDHRAVTQPIRPEPLRSTGISLSEQETRDYLSQHSPGIQGRQFTSLPSIEQQSGSRNKQAISVSNKVGFIVIFLLSQNIRVLKTLYRMLIGNLWQCRILGRDPGPGFSPNQQ